MVADADKAGSVLGVRILLGVNYKFPGAATYPDGSAVDMTEEQTRALLAVLKSTIERALEEIQGPTLDVIYAEVRDFHDLSPEYQAFREAQAQARRFEGPMWGKIKPLEI